MPYCCQFCDEYFIRRDRLDEHCNNFHKSSLVLAHACEICGERFAWFGDLTSHIATHYDLPSTKERAWSTAQCEFCGKIMRKNSLNAHVVIHSTEKPFSCELCGSSFVSRPSLKLHQRSHSEGKKYECEVCKKKFKYSTTLANHRLDVHTEKEPWSCNVCGKSFTRKGVLKYHLRTHTKEQPYQCAMCNRRFKKTSALKVHLRVHTKEKPYSCDDCGKTFSHKVSLVKYHRCPNAKGNTAAAIISENVEQE